MKSIHFLLLTASFVCINQLYATKEKENINSLNLEEKATKILYTWQTEKNDLENVITLELEETVNLILHNLRMKKRKRQILPKIIKRGRPKKSDLGNISEENATIILLNLSTQGTKKRPFYKRIKFIFSPKTTTELVAPDKILINTIHSGNNHNNQISSCFTNFSTQSNNCSKFYFPISNNSPKFQYLWEKELNKLSVQEELKALKLRRPYKNALHKRLYEQQERLLQLKETRIKRYK